MQFVLPPFSISNLSHFSIQFFSPHFSLFNLSPFSIRLSNLSPFSIQFFFPISSFFYPNLKSVTHISTTAQTLKIVANQNFNPMTTVFLVKAMFTSFKNQSLSVVGHFVRNHDHGNCNDDHNFKLKGDCAETLKDWSNFQRHQWARPNLSWTLLNDCNFTKR